MNLFARCLLLVTLTLVGLQLGVVLCVTDLETKYNDFLSKKNKVSKDLAEIADYKDTIEGVKEMYAEKGEIENAAKNPSFSATVAEESAGIKWALAQRVDFVDRLAQASLERAQDFYSDDLVEYNKAKESVERLLLDLERQQQQAGSTVDPSLTAKLKEVRDEPLPLEGGAHWSVWDVDAQHFFMLSCLVNLRKEISKYKTDHVKPEDTALTTEFDGFLSKLDNVQTTLTGLLGSDRKVDRAKPNIHETLTDCWTKIRDVEDKFEKVSKSLLRRLWKKMTLKKFIWTSVLLVALVCLGGFLYSSTTQEEALHYVAEASAPPTPVQGKGDVSPGTSTGETIVDVEGAEAEETLPQTEGASALQAGSVTSSGKEAAAAETHAKTPSESAASSVSSSVALLTVLAGVISLLI